ncbi:MAG: hypothetical protein IPP55_14030 [Anaerolineales bacterium]|nr:hypothetical protein [Anaerolineales bacterium]
MVEQKGCRHRRMILRCGIWHSATEKSSRSLITRPGLDTSSYVFSRLSVERILPEYVEKAYSFLKDTLQTDDAGVGLMLRCCGAPADWAGRKELFANSQSEFRAEYEKLGKPKVILSCSSCYQMFKNIIPMWKSFPLGCDE